MPEYGDIQFTVQRAFVATYDEDADSFINPVEIEYATEFGFTPLADEEEIKEAGANREKLTVIIGAESTIGEASMKADAYNVAMGYAESSSGSSGNRIRTLDTRGAGGGKPYIGLIVIVMATRGQSVYGFPKSKLKIDQQFEAGINEFRIGELKFEHLVLFPTNKYMRRKNYESDTLPDFSQVSAWRRFFYIPDNIFSNEPPQIEVYGNSNLIVNGDASPSATDDTDFGLTPVAMTVTKTFTIENVGIGTLTSVIVSVSSGYTVTVAPDTEVLPGESTTFSVRFDASSGTTFDGTVTITSNIEPYSFAITAEAEYVALARFNFSGGLFPTGGGTYNGEVGTLTVTDTGSFTSLASGRFQSTQQVGFPDPQIVTTTTFARARGLSALYGGYLRGTLVRSLIRWVAAADPQALAFESGFDFYNIGGDFIAINTGFSATRGDFALVFDDTLGGGVFGRAAGAGNFVLHWLDQVGNKSNMGAGWSAIAAGTPTPDVVSLESLGVWQDYENVLLVPQINVASPVNSQVYTGTANAIVDISVTAPGSLGVEAGLIFRRVDGNNYWRAYFDASGAFKVDRVVVGVATNHINVAGVISAATTRRIRVKLVDNTIEAFTKSGTTWTKRGSTITNTTHQNATDVVVDIGSGWSVSNLRSDATYSTAITTLFNAWLALQS
jgi:hypothetical protein